jgi:hypothetical protein
MLMIIIANKKSRTASLKGSPAIRIRGPVAFSPCLSASLAFASNGPIFLLYFNYIISESGMSKCKIIPHVQVF